MSDGLSGAERQRMRRALRERAVREAPERVPRAPVHSEGEFICAVREVLGLDPCEFHFTGMEAT